MYDGKSSCYQRCMNCSAASRLFQFAVVTYANYGLGVGNNLFVL